MGKPVITVVGSYAVGMTMRSARFPSSGETLMGHSFHQMHGGKGSNQAVACARLGAETTLIASVGMDVLGDAAIKLHETEGVNTSNILRIHALPTGVGFIIVDDFGHNIITLDMGANCRLTPQYLETLEHVLAASDVVLMQMEIPIETVAATARIARKHGVKTILNPAPYQRFPDDAWKDIDIVTPNEKEAKLIMGYSPDEVVLIDELGRGLLEKGVGSAIITLGGRGSYYATCRECVQSMLIPVRQVDVVDTTGAGDTFSAALGVAIAEGEGLNEAIRFASAAATLSVMKYGVIESLPYRHEVSAWAE